MTVCGPGLARRAAARGGRARPGGRLQPQGLQRLQWPHRPARGRQGRDGAGRRHHGRAPRLSTSTTKAMPRSATC
jgi:hypothetical protein